MKRGAIQKQTSRLLTLWVPEALFPVLDQGVQLEDSDRSKFIRNAIREKCQRIGVPMPDKQKAA